MFKTKPIAPHAIARAMQKAERYRLLQEPVDAESICLDVLEIEPDNQEALQSLLLALTDQFSGGARLVLGEAKQLLSRLQPYAQKYYAGVIAERYARHHLREGHPGARFSAYAHLRDAMEDYLAAQGLATEGNYDATLRYNTCVRMIQWYSLEAAHQEEREQPLE